MSEDFKERIRALKAQFPEWTEAEKRARRIGFKRRNKLGYYRFEMMRRDILRLEAKRSQLLLEGNQKQIAEIENKILEKKKHWLEIFYRH